MEVKRSPTPLSTRALAVPAPGAGVVGAAAAREVAKCRWAASRAALATARDEPHGGSLLLLVLPLASLPLASVAAVGCCGCSSSKRASASLLKATRCGSCSSSLRLYGKQPEKKAGQASAVVAGRAAGKGSHLAITHVLPPAHPPTHPPTHLRQRRSSWPS